MTKEPLEPEDDDEPPVGPEHPPHDAPEPFVQGE